MLDQLQAHAGRGRPRAGRRWSRSASWPASSRDAAVGAVHRPARRLPGGAGGRAQAQGARLHARRGLRRRRAQARPDRADRRGHAGRLRRPVAARPRPAARQDRVEHPGGTGPRRPHHRDRRGGRRGGRARTPTTSSRCRDADAARTARRPPCRCRCSRARSPPPAATTSTSPATSPSPSPSSNPSPRHDVNACSRTRPRHDAPGGQVQAL